MDAADGTTSGKYLEKTDDIARVMGAKGRGCQRSVVIAVGTATQKTCAAEFLRNAPQDKRVIINPPIAKDARDGTPGKY